MGNMDKQDYLKHLTKSGYEPNVDFDENSFNQQRINELRKVIRKCFRHGRCLSMMDEANSYKMKHVMENYLGRKIQHDGCINGYVSNGELIYAMILEGFKVRRNGRNCFFNVIPTDVRALDAFTTLLKGNRYESMYPARNILRRIEEVWPECKGKWGLEYANPYVLCSLSED